MKTSSGVPTPERFYQLLLFAYPQEFRAEYGREMAVLFRDLSREGDVGSVRFWIAIIGDVARSAPALRAAAWRDRGKKTRTVEVLMKFVAMIAVLLGAFATANAVSEAIAGMRGTMTVTYVLTVTLGVLAGALLLTAGVVLLRRTPSARRVATAAAVGSIALIVVVRMLHPWMSIFSQLVVVALSITLLIAVHWPRRSTVSSAV
jgi:hypothetical protein